MNMIAEPKPRNPWVAVLFLVLFGVLGPPAAMCYLGKGRAGAAYFFVPLLIMAGLFALWWHGMLPYPEQVLYAFTALYVVIGISHVLIAARHYVRLTPIKWYARWYNIIGIFIVPVLFAIFFRFSILEPFDAVSVSMSPAINSKDYFVVKKYAYHGLHPARGDIVIFGVGLPPKIDTYVKRVVGMPGDTVQLKEGVVFINGTELVRRKIDDFALKQPGKAVTHSIAQFEETLPEGKHFRILQEFTGGEFNNTEEVRLPSDNYFLLGDNRDNSIDSRMPKIGLVPKDAIVGKAAFVLFNYGVQQPDYRSLE
jgi:signal peptidase I